MLLSIEILSQRFYLSHLTVLFALYVVIEELKIGLGVKHRYSQTTYKQQKQAQNRKFIFQSQ